MMPGLPRTILVATAITSLYLLWVTRASGQPSALDKPQLAQNVFKNVQVLKGISVSEFMGTMGLFSASLGLNCTDCHISESSGDWARYAEDTPLKRTSRRMILMVDGINRNNFAGRRAVACYSCHRGAIRPRLVPSLLEQYSAPAPDDPNDIEMAARLSATPSADEILNRFIQAIGGAPRLASLTTVSAKGTYQGFDTDLETRPLEIFAKAPNQRAAIVHLRTGDNITTYSGQAGWIAAPDKPAPLLTLFGADLDGLQLDAALAFPATLKQTLTQWRAGFPPAMIDDQAVQVIQAILTGGSRVKFFFAKQSGLLLRTVRFTVTAVGVIPTQTDYSDYRELAGVRMPFHWTITWTDGQSTVELSELQPNAAIDPNQLAKPSPPNRPVAK